MVTGRHLWKVFAFAALVIATLHTATAQATPPSTDWPNGRIAFTGCGDTGCNVYTVNPDGTALRQVTHDDSSFLPDWSPDASLITYVSFVSGFTSIWITDAQGSNPRQLTPDDPESFNLWPRFMPDGRTILYTNCFGGDCHGGISTIDIDGNNQRAITPNSGNSYNIAAPSPDGRRLAFMRWHVQGELMRIYLLRMGADSERPVSPRELEGWAPDWSPDGSNILFSSNVFGNRPNGAIYSIHPDGEGLQQLTYPKFPLEDWYASYSPNGARIVFASDRRYPDRCCSDLFTMPGGESKTRNVQPDTHEGEEGTLIRRIPLPLFANEPRWGTAPLIAETSSIVSLTIERPSESFSKATMNPTAIAKRSAAVRDVCKLVPMMARTPMCGGW